MRFDTGFLVILAALSHLPAGSGRVLYGLTPSARDLVDQPANATFVERAVVVPKPKPVTGPKDPAVVAPGEKPPLAPGDAPAEPAPLVPGEKPPTAPGDKTPDENAPLVPAEKEPAKPAGDKPEDGPLVPADKEPVKPATDKPDDVSAGKGIDDLDLWCPNVLGMVKRDLTKRADRSCGRNRDPADVRSREAREADYGRRGRRARQLITTREYNDIDYRPRIDTNYNQGRARSPDDGASAWEDTVPQSRSRGYDFSTRPEDWRTYDTFSPGVSEPMVRASYHRRQRPIEEDDDWAVMVAHDRWGNRDSNRWQVDRHGNPMTRRNPTTNEDEYIPADNWRDRSAPVSEMTWTSGTRDNHFGPRADHPITPRRMTMYSEGLSGRETRLGVNEAFESTGRGDQYYMRLQADAQDARDRAAWEQIAGLDNSYSNTNMVVRRRENADYRQSHIDVWRENPESPQDGGYMLADTWERPRRRWE